MVDTSFSGNVVGESAMRSIGDVGSPVEFVFHVSLRYSLPAFVRDMTCLLVLKYIFLKCKSGS